MDPVVDAVKKELDAFTKAAEERAKEGAAKIDGVAKDVVNLKGTVDEIKKQQGTTEEWVKRVEAQVNTARSKDAGGDALKNAIPEDYRIYIEREERRGVKDPVQKVAQSLWFHSLHMAKVASLHIKDTPHTAPEYLKIADALEQALGFSPVMKAALGEGAAGGGNIIPTPVEAVIYRLIMDNGVMRPLVTRIPMTAPTHKLPNEANAVSCTIVAENATIPDSVATTQFGQVNLTARKFAGLATVSNELLETNIVGLSDYLFTAIAEKVARLEDSECLDGQGTNFTGLAITAGVVSITVTGTAASGGVAPTYGDLVTLVFAAVEQATRVNASFVMHPVAMKNVVSLADQQGMPIFQFSNVPNAIPDRILGYPVYLSSAVSKTNSLYTSSTNIYFGPMGKIIFGDLTGIGFATDPYGLFDKDQTRLRVTKRTGIVTPVGAYFAYLKGVKNT